MIGPSSSNELPAVSRSAISLRSAVAYAAAPRGKITRMEIRPAPEPIASALSYDADTDRARRLLPLVREGFAKSLEGTSAQIAFQAPERVRVSAEVANKTYMVGRNGQELWAYVPHKKFGVVGKTG